MSKREHADDQSRPGSGTARESQKLWDGRIRSNPDASGVGCAGFGLQYNRWLYRIRAHRFRQLVGKLGLDLGNIRVLDVGSGTGFYIGLWQQLGVNKVEGLDFTEAACEFLGKKFPDITVYLEDIASEDLDLPAESYDIVSAYDVLFHIVDDQAYARALANISRLLKPGGYLVFSENFTHHQHIRGGPYHYSRSIFQIEPFLDEAGIKILYRRPMFVLMNAPDDSKGRLLKSWWRMVTAAVRQGEKAAWLTAAMLFPLERLLTSLLKESPSTEVAVCVRTKAG